MSIVSNSDLLILIRKLDSLLDELILKDNVSSERFSIFFSYGSKKQRCKVWSNTDQNLKHIKKRLLSFVEKIFHKNKNLLDYIKVDLAYNVAVVPFSVLHAEIKKQKHNNHFRKGVAFDDKLSVCFLEQEIYGKAIIKGIVYNQPNFLDEKNLNDAILKKYPSMTRGYGFSEIDQVWTFDTYAAFYENGKFIELHSTAGENGIRIIDGNKKQHIKSLIIKNAEFLHAEILADGKFKYGYFPAYDREIKSYNTVRHCTALYALLETLEVEYRNDYLEKIILSIDYAIHHFYKEIDEKAFLIDHQGEEDEIKLGSNATAIFMLAKYQEITKDNRYQEYAEKLAEGIRFMVNAFGETTHVLKYPSLEIKEKFRIVYYDGEAALGLLRLYQINGNQELIDIVKLMFEHFITKKYDQYHDHWLSYCTNELTMICPEEKYFKFGLNNYIKHMDFKKKKKTAYATFLEMMMSAYKMVSRLKAQGFDDLYAESKFEDLKKLIESRVEFQHKTGFFYPEMAMYMSNPSKILNAFYVRHDRFRTRIDDQEHNLSGYVAYYNFFGVE